MNSPALNYHVETPAAATVNPVVQPIQSTLPPATVEYRAARVTVTAGLRKHSMTMLEQRANDT